MKLYLIRHGEPDYSKDCLTEKGVVQAKNVSEYFADKDIDFFFSSAMQRAYQTAIFSAEIYNKPVKKLEFLNEIKVRAKDKSVYDSLSPEEVKAYNRENCRIWNMARKTVLENLPLSSESPYFAKTDYLEKAKVIEDGFIGFLSECGYVREERYFKSEKVNENTLAIFAHAGTIAKLVSILTFSSFEWVVANYSFDLAGISLIEFENNDAGSYILPKIKFLNSISHLEKENIK